MTISDAQFTAWLNQDGKNRCVLAEITFVGVKSVLPDAAHEFKVCISNASFVTTDTDTPANWVYEDAILGIPSFSRRMSTAFTGRTSQSWGDLIVANNDGERDDWLRLNWIGREIVLYVGDPGWAKADFRTVMTGVVSEIYAASAASIGFRIKDKIGALNVPVETALFTSGDALDRLKPVAYGTIFNATPVLIDAATHKYQVAQASGTVSEVRDNGVAVGITDNGDGTFTLTSAPAGQITCDFAEATTTAGGIISALAVDSTALVSGDIDATTFGAFDTDVPYDLGIYIAERRNVIEAMDEVANSVGAWYGFDRAGLLQIGQLDTPGTTYTMAIDAEDMVAFSFMPVRFIQPAEYIRFGYAKNYTRQQSGLAGSLSETELALYAADFSSASYTTDAGSFSAGTGPFAYTPAPYTPDQIKSLISNSTDATTEVTRQATLWSRLKGIYKFTMFAKGYELDIGDTVQITHSRHGFSAGKTAIVTAIADKDIGGKMRVDVEVFTTVTEYVPHFSYPSPYSVSDYQEIP